MCSTPKLKEAVSRDGVKKAWKLVCDGPDVKT